MLAKNYEGLLELNALISKASEDSHFYYKPRISFEEFLGISENIISTSACLSSPLNRLAEDNEYYEKLISKYDYLEIQPHRHNEQVAYNQKLYRLSLKYNKPLICGTDTHSLNKYKAECRGILQAAKRIDYDQEDSFDLTFKSYYELCDMFGEQDALPRDVWLEAIENTNRLANSVEQIELDTSFKYPKLYGDRDTEVFYETLDRKLNEKIATGIIPNEQIAAFKAAIKEECRVFEKIDMCGFMLFMAELVDWANKKGIPYGFGRGSVGGSRVAYILDIIDLNPEAWQTIFSRFANEDRKEIGDYEVIIVVRILYTRRLLSTKNIK